MLFVADMDVGVTLEFFMVRLRIRSRGSMEDDCMYSSRKLYTLGRKHPFFSLLKGKVQTDLPN